MLIPGLFTMAEISSGSADDLAHALRELAASSQSGVNDALVPAGKRKCPICGKCMETLSQHEVTLDLCAEHGVWLDQGELSTILERAYLYRRELESRPSVSQAERLEATAKDFRRSVTRVTMFLRSR